ncbi:MAG TPA: 3'-5' exonuclease [Thermomicrobiaceae bacterium]|nr:3'-5' exonuclease [Thermomicrobiaceae bacterium]HEX5396244.1 3'-5' exonuclease [Candidatus Limnocylindria bacterium]
MAVEQRQAIVTWARTIQQRHDVAFLDTETTGLRHHDEIVDIALVDAAGQTLLNTLVRPSRPIPPEVVAIHGITDAHVASSPPWPEVYPELRRLLRAFPCLVIYNAPFDLRLLDQTCRRFDLSPLSATIEAHCAMRRYAQYAGPGKRWRLQDALAALGARASPAHRALADANACRQVVSAMADEIACRPTIADRRRYDF